MLNYSDLTIVNNSEGVPTALGYPVNSILLQNNKPLFMSGGGRGKNKKEKEEEFNIDQLAVPAGLICMTQTVCKSANAMGANAMGANAMGANAYETGMGANAMGANAMGAYEMGAYEMEPETIPEGLYEQLLALAETKPNKKMTRRKQALNKGEKRKTKRNK
jgi:hypothetical protein